MIDFTDGFVILAYRHLILYFEVTKYLEDALIEKDKAIEIQEE